MKDYIRYLFGVILCMFFVSQVSAQQINYAEYFFDTDPGRGNGTALPVSSTNTIDASFTIPTSALSPGMHNLYIRTRSTDGLWSLNANRIVFINPIHSTFLSKIVEGEYFIDIDPGFGNGNSLTLTAGDTVSITQTAATSSLSSGIHNLFVRFKNGYGKWSLSQQRLIYVNNNHNIGQIVAAEYFFDNDPGEGNATSVTVASGNTIDLTNSISVSSLGAGLHFLNFRVKDSKNQWSLAERQLFYISQPITTRNLAEAEYFYDDDPGFGNGNSITISAGDSINLITTLNSSTLNSGVHFVNIRVKDQNGKWSLAERKLIYVLDGQLQNPRIVDAEYYFDDDPGFGNGTSFSPSAGNTIDISAAIASSSLDMGSHIFNVRAKDSLGRWSLVSSQVIYVNASLSSQKIVSIEYSVDTIMPFGQGSRVNFSGVDTLDYNFSFVHGITDTFYHELYVRIKDMGGRWSLLDSIHFRLENCIIPTAIFSINDFCYGDSITLYNNSLDTDTASVYHWDLGNDGFVESNDSTSYVFNPSAPGTYKISLKVTNFVCIDTAIQTVHVFPKPDNSISIFGSSTFCPGSFAVLAANTGVGYTYQWLKNGSAIANATGSFYQAQDSGSYRAAIQNIYNCTDTTSNIDLGIYSLPDAVITLNGNSAICTGDSVKLSAPLQAGITYQWLFNGDSLQGATNHEFWCKNTGDYRLKIKNSNGCTDLSAAQTIVVNPVPNATIQAGGATTLCSGQNVVLYGSNGVGYSYKWLKDGAEVVGETNSFFGATQTGNYQVLITNNYQCSDTSNSTSVTVNPSPVVNVSFNGSATVCQGDTVVLHGPADAGLTYQWNSYGTPVSGATDSVLSVIQTGNFTLVATNSFNCSTTSAGQVITVNPVPGASILPMGSTSFCNGDSVVLQANAGSGLSYQWFKDGLNQSGIVGNLLSAKTSGNYTVNVTNSFNCSTESQAISVTAFPIPTANFGLNAINCASDTISLQYQGNASSSAFYNWNFGGAIVLSGNGQGPFNLVFTQAGIKTVSLTVSENGCVSNSVSHTTEILSVPSFITAPVTSACDGDSILLTANSGNNLSYQWFQGGLALQNDTFSVLKVTNSGGYSVEVQDISIGCSKMSTVVPVTLHTTNFNLDFTASTTNFSQPPFNVTITNQTPNLNNYNFLWELGDGNTSTFFNPIHTYQYNGNYTVALYAENATTGCRDTLIKTDYISCSGGAPNPCNILAAITPAGPVTICGGDSVLLTASAGTGYTYQWVYNNMIINGATSQTFKAKQAGNYRVVVSDAICSQTSPAFVLNHYPSIQPVIQATGQIQPCTFDSLQLSLFVNYNHYNWSTGDTTTSIWVSQTGYYQVAVTDNFGCNLTSQPYVVNNSFLNPPEICIVGVDSNNHNRLVWERQANALIDSFYIYREGFMANQYDKIGAIPFSQTSLFVDVNSNPAIQSYRYRIAAVDTCGGVTLLSDYHKTIHLTINAGLNGSWNLIWDGYQGFPFSTYRIYRGSSAATMTLLTQLPSTATSYTDLNPPTGTVFYQIEVIKTSGCYPDTVVSKANTNYNTSRSNTANNSSIVPIYLTANFSANVQSGQWPIQVEFNDLSTGSPNSWEWDFGDGNGSVVQNPKHTYNNTGLYTVKLKVCNGNTCDTVTKVGYINVLPNGLVEIGVELSAKLYPNPNDGNFTLEINDKSSRRLELRVYNAIGEEIFMEDFYSQGHTLKTVNISTLSKGIYFVHLNSSDNIIYREKIIVQ